jgi:hypothetical protein
VRNVLVGLLWLSVLVSLSVYAYRIYRRLARGPKAEREATDDARPGTTPTAPTASGSVNTDLDRVLDQAARSSGRDPSTAIEGVPPRDGLGADRPVSDSAPATDPTSSAGARSGLFASTAPPSGAPSAGSTGDARATVAEMLTGVSMPCDLVPVVDPDGLVNPYRVAFATQTTPAADVGAAVGDELERLGFALRSVSSNQVEATKADQKLTVTIHQDASAVTAGDGPSYPTLPAGSVVVEFAV